MDLAALDHKLSAAEANPARAAEDLEPSEKSSLCRVLLSVQTSVEGAPLTQGAPHLAVFPALIFDTRCL